VGLTPACLHTLLDVSDALAALPLPVAVVAAVSNGVRSCSTGTLTYVSYTPALVATPLAKTSRTLALLRERGAFSISVLADDQAELAVRAARPSDGDKFTEQSIPILDDDVAPAVAGAALVLWCALESCDEAGAYVLCVGRVERSHRDEREPLLRFDRRYRALGRGIDVAEEAPYPL
jgi:flavin reductase (DIM6/NTAB) family NADH-FMN oxidoreductase RutF